jgi:hypothetical protein
MTELRIYPRSRRAKVPHDDDATLDGLIEAFEALRAFVRETAASGSGAIAYLT